MSKFKVRVAVLASALVGVNAFGAECTYTDGAWDTAPSGESDDIVIVSGDLTWGAALPHKVASWTQAEGYTGTVTFETTYGETFPLFEVTGDVVLNGGSWTHKANSNAETYRLNVKVGGDMTLAGGTEVKAYKKGFRQGGAGKAARGATGAAHGGRGYNQYAGERTVCFGSIREPIRIGSTAGSNASAGSEAGGAICLTVGGRLSVDGAICADGSQTGSGFYVGSGGSVWITAGSIAGASCGVVSANAGTGPSYAGGGGRVSICLTGEGADFTDYAGETTAYGAINSSGVAYTGAGTVYFETKADGFGKGRLVVDGKNISSCDQWFTELIFADQVEGFDPSTIEVKNNGRLWVWDAGSLSPKKLVFSGGGRLRIGSACDLDLSEVEMSGDSASAGVYISKPINLNLGTELTISGGCLWIASAGVVCTSGDLLTLQDGGTLNVSYPFSYPGDILVKAGGKITQLANTADNSHQPTSDYHLDLTVGGNLTVDEGGWIGAWGCGWPRNTGTGSGSDAWGGGGHGALGFGSYNGSIGVGECYGSLTKPVSLGSGVSSGTASGTGGGAVKLTVAGDFVNNGLVDADGKFGSYGAGPGGSVWITAKTLSGAGRIEADGNGTNCVNSTCSHAAGAGGRVAVWLTDPTATFDAYTGSITAYGARGNNNNAAGPGTVYLKTGAQAANEGTLYIDNGKAPANTTTDIGRYVTDAEVGSVVIAKNAKLRLRNSGVLTVRGDITCEGSLTAIDDATLAFAGSGTSTVHCDLAVQRLACMTPGKAIAFDEGKTMTVNQKLTLEGEEGNLVLLKSADGSSWNLVVNAAAEQSVKRVRVEKCDASGGAQVIATDSEMDDATTNWKTINIVKGQVITWTGNAGASGWALADNWDLGRAPVETDDIRIESAAVMPELTAATTVYRLTVAEGASLSLAGFDLTATDAVAVDGRLVAVASEQIRLHGDVAIAANGFDMATSSVTLDGTAAQTFAPNGNVFYRFTFDNASAAGVTVASSFDASYLTAEAADEPVQIAFADGVTMACGVAAVLTGDEASPNLTLKPAEGGKTWNIAVSGSADIHGVVASGSQATANEIFASSSTDGGGNDRWHFGTFTSAVWKGEASADFHTAENWDPAVVPDENTAVVIDAAKPVTILQPVLVRELTIGGTAAQTVSLKASVEVAGAVMLKSGANVSFDAKNVLLKLGGSLVMDGGSAVTHAANPSVTDNPYRVNIDVGGDMVVNANAKVEAYGKGYPSGVGLGGKAVGDFYGGTHGGQAYGYYGKVYDGGSCYGSVTRPSDPGSGTSRNDNASGGGVIRLVVRGRLRNDGYIDSNGGLGTDTIYAGPGGSVWVTCGQLTGTGVIEASAGSTTRLGSHDRSGGGRVAVWLTDAGADFGGYTGRISAYSSSFGAAPGTVYKKTGDEAANEGTLVIDNGGVNAPVYTDISADVTDAEVGSVVVAADSKFRISGSGTLTVLKDITVNGSFTSADAGALVFAGSDVSTVRGNLSLAKFICRTPGKTIGFANGSTVSCTVQFVAEGSKEAPVSLKSADGTVWNLSLAVAAEQSVERASVEKCDASGGAQVVALDSEKDEATLNWKTINIVPGETITWTGAAGATGWALPANWDLERAPVETDVIVIAPAAVQPVLTANATTANLTINKGASLSLAGFDLTVNGDFAVNGQLKAAATERILVTGNAAFAAKSFVKDHSTLVLAGTAAQTFWGGDNSFYNLVFANTSAEGVTVGSSFEASSVTAETEVATQIAFASGVTATVGASLVLAGDTTAKNLTLRPSVADTTWNLKVKGTANVSGVTVSGSQATGNDVFASDSVDAGGNAKWHFGTFSAAKWTGETSDAFDEPSNWEGGVVPDADTAVEIDTDKPLKITSEVTVRELVVGGSAASSVTVKAPVNVVGAMVLRDQANVTADAKVTVGGSLVMNAGSKLTHSSNSRIDLVVEGDVSVDAGAAITADGCGPTGSCLGNAGSSGASHGGTGGTHGTAANCYGSIFCPTNAGSSAVNDTIAGGGVIRIVVAGAIVVDGAIQANGALRGNWYGTSGGSVWITCGQLAGNGVVSANGERSGSGYHGAGGRVAVYLTQLGATLGDFASHVSADPGNLTGAPGTVYVQKADEADYCGTVRIVNNPNASEFGGSETGTFVQYPMRSRLAADPRRGNMKIELGERVRFSLVEDASVGELIVNGTKPKIFLNGHTLKVRTWVSKEDQARILARVQDADKGGGICWLNAFMLIVR